MGKALLTLGVVAVIVIVILSVIFAKIIRIYEGKSRKTVVTVESKVLMPSGMEAPAEYDMLHPDMSWADALARLDLSWIINYIGHKIDAIDAEGDRALREEWRNSYVFFSSIKNQKGWWV